MNLDYTILMNFFHDILQLFNVKYVKIFFFFFFFTEDFMFAPYLGVFVTWIDQPGNSSSRFLLQERFIENIHFLS